MTWRFLFEPFKNDKENTSADGTEAPVESPAALTAKLMDQDEAYQKKLFENDLYVWSLLLLGNDKI